MRYVGPLPFPGETLGDVWDASPETRAAVEAAVAEARAEERHKRDIRLETAEEQAGFASDLLENLEDALASATRLRDYRKDFKRIVRGSSFEGA